jgi:hypothetical protein
VDDADDRESRPQLSFGIVDLDSNVSAAGFVVDELADVGDATHDGRLARGRNPNFHLVTFTHRREIALIHGEFHPDLREVGDDEEGI